MRLALVSCGLLLELDRLESCALSGQRDNSCTSQICCSFVLSRDAWSVCFNFPLLHDQIWVILTRQFI